MAELKSEKFHEASECLSELHSQIVQICKVRNPDCVFMISIDKVDEEHGVIILGGSKGDGESLSPFILREPALSQVERAFKSRLPWVSRVVDRVVYGYEETCARLDVEIDSRKITG